AHGHGGQAARRIHLDRAVAIGQGRVDQVLPLVEVSGRQSSTAGVAEVHVVGAAQRLLPVGPHAFDDVVCQQRRLAAQVGTVVLLQADQLQRGEAKQPHRGHQQGDHHLDQAEARGATARSALANDHEQASRDVRTRPSRLTETSRRASAVHGSGTSAKSCSGAPPAGAGVTLPLAAKRSHGCGLSRTSPWSRPGNTRISSKPAPEVTGLPLLAASWNTSHCRAAQPLVALTQALPSLLEQRVTGRPRFTASARASCSAATNSLATAARRLLRIIAARLGTAIASSTAATAMVISSSIRLK